MPSLQEHRVASLGSLPRGGSARKRTLNKLPSYSDPGTKERPIDLSRDPEDPDIAHKAKRRKLPALQEVNVEERRRRRFRTHPPQSYLERYERAQTQRMFVIDRRREDTQDGLAEIVDIAGTTGNIYEVTISKMPICTCPDSVKGNQCKHIIYIVCNVLKAPTHLRYQLAYLSSELREIFSNAPLSGASKILGRKSSNRKELDGDCPICFMQFEPDEETVYCKSSCGNNVHKGCFEQWIRAQAGQEIRCVFCRAPWKCDDEIRDMIQRLLLEKRKQVTIGPEGYINVARELELSGARDTSTYHQHWVASRGRSIQYSSI